MCTYDWGCRQIRAVVLAPAATFATSRPKITERTTSPRVDFETQQNCINITRLCPGHWFLMVFLPCLPCTQSFGINLILFAFALINSPEKNNLCYLCMALYVLNLCTYFINFLCFELPMADGKYNLPIFPFLFFFVFGRTKLEIFFL